MSNEFYLIELNNLFNLDYRSLIDKCLDSNPFISRIAIDVLLKREEEEVIPDIVLSKIVNKMTIEEVYNLVVSKTNSSLARVAYSKLKEILNYYDNNIELYQKIQADNEYFLKLKEHL